MVSYLFTLASVAEVSVASVTLVAFAYVAGDLVAAGFGAGGGLADAVAAVARRGAQITRACRVPSARLVWA